MASARPVDFSSGDHYTVLGVPRGASEADINRAYKTLARRYHPDKNPGDKQVAELSFKRIAEAYAVLRDPESRKQYDVTGGTQSYVSYEEAERMWHSYCAAGRDDDREGLPAGIPRDMEARRKAMGLLLVVIVLFAAPRFMMQLLPGLTAVVVAIAVLSRRENASKWALCALALLLAGYIAPWSLRVRSGISAQLPAGAEPPQGLAEGRWVPHSLAEGRWVPHSGEEVMLSNGTFVRIADPRMGKNPDGEVEEGWQDRLLASTASAIRLGQEQVVMVFSRQGCPWCDRQLPVLQRAIQRRSNSNRGAIFVAPEEEEAQEVMEQMEQKDTPKGPQVQEAKNTAFLLPGGGRSLAAVIATSSVPPAPGALLNAPVRVFIFDAEEFPYFAQNFRVEAFPTTLAWGSPGSTPQVVQGYLGDDEFEGLLRAAAGVQPRDGEVEKAGRRGLFR